MRRAIAISALCVLVVSCSRDLDFPATLQLGNSCAENGRCASNACVDGVCCEAPCATNETCARPGAQGHCEPKQLGDACASAANCPGGAYCVTNYAAIALDGGSGDGGAPGVCCDTACDGGCMTCTAASGPPGTCVPQADNQDERNYCGYCNACFDGACAPAVAGTNPNASSCSDGRVCNMDQFCAVALGLTCQQDIDCAVGNCLLGSCVEILREEVWSPQMSQLADNRIAMGLAQSVSGSIAVLYAEQTVTPGQGDTAPDPRENDAWLAGRSADGGWSAAPLFRDLAFYWNWTPPYPPVNAAVESIGDSFVVVGSSWSAEGVDGFGCAASADAGSAVGALPCGVVFWLVAPSGQLSALHALDGNVRTIGHIELHRPGPGRIVAFYSAAEASATEARPARSVFVQAGAPRTDGGVGWSPIGSVEVSDGGNGSAYWGATVLGDSAYVFDADSNSDADTIPLQTHRIAEGNVFPEDSYLLDGTLCGAAAVISISVVPLDADSGGGHSTILLSVSCRQAGVMMMAPLLLRYDPDAPTGSQFQALFAASASDAGHVELHPAGRYVSDGGAFDAFLAAGKYDNDPNQYQLELGSISESTGALSSMPIWTPLGASDLGSLSAGMIDGMPAAEVISGTQGVDFGSSASATQIELVRFAH